MLLCFRCRGGRSQARSTAGRRRTAHLRTGGRPAHGPEVLPVL